MPPPFRVEDPAILNLMTVSVLQVPGEGYFHRYVTEEELSDLEKRDRKTVLALSEMEQWSIWHTEQLAIANQQIYYLESEKIRLQLQLAADRSAFKRQVESILAEQKQQSFKMGVAKWVAMTFAAALIGALLKSVIERLG